MIFLAVERNKMNRAETYRCLLEGFRKDFVLYRRKKIILNRALSYTNLLCDFIQRSGFAWFLYA